MNQFAGLLLFLVASLGFLLLSVLVLFYAERKVSAFIQDRMGPTHVGPAGILQPAADLIKLLRKETLVPSNARKAVFLFAPLFLFASVFSGFSLLPLFPDLFPHAPLPAGILLVAGLISLEAPGIVLAAFSSRSKFPVLGATRAVAQMVSYEIPLGISLLTILWLTGTGDFAQIRNAQLAGDALIPGAGWGGIFGWNAFRYPVLLLLLPGFFLSVLAESNRAPFDIPEGESEIIGGFHTEYSGFLWAVFFLAEYAMMIILSILFSWLFLGADASPIPGFGLDTVLSRPNFVWLVLKVWSLGFSMIWIRWTLPRLRVDQLTDLAWKILIPLSLFVFILVVLFW